jgi:hypothetical protein
MSSEEPNPTRVHRGPVDTVLPAPIQAGGSTEMEAYERAPTLMGSDAPASQGDMRVWGPDHSTLWFIVAVFAAGLLLAPVMLFMHSSIWYILYNTGMIAVSLYWSISVLRRPGYIATDDAGIGITARSGSRAVRWSEIEAVRLVSSGSIGFAMELGVPEKVSVNLAGYSGRDRKELMRLIVKRAGLIQPNRKQSLWVRKPGPELPRGPGQSLPAGGQD